MSENFSPLGAMIVRLAVYLPPVVFMAIVTKPIFVAIAQHPEYIVTATVYVVMVLVWTGLFWFVAPIRLVPKSAIRIMGILAAVGSFSLCFVIGGLNVLLGPTMGGTPPITLDQYGYMILFAVAMSPGVWYFYNLIFPPKIKKPPINP
jgi:hypothetical protein